MNPPPKIPRVLLLIETSRAYGRAILEGIGNYAHGNGPWSFYFEERGQDDPAPAWLKDWKGEGIISRTRQAKLARALHATGLPVVELHGAPQFGMPHIYTDDDASACLATDHFLERGLRSLAFFATDKTWWIEQRGDAFENMLRERGQSCVRYPLQPRKGLEEMRWHHRDRERIGYWLDSLEKPVGIFCATDRYAALLLDVCRTRGIPVPEQISVLGTNNDSVICNLSQPPLSSIDQNPQRIGYEAAALLDRMMAGKAAPHQPILIPPSHIEVRRSTDILAISDADVAQAVRYIREHACRGLNVNEVAETLALSRRTLERRFAAMLKRSIKSEIRRVQMDRAKYLLRERELPLDAVARRSGFGSLSYFIKAFMRDNGVTPGDYRRS